MISQDISIRTQEISSPADDDGQVNKDLDERFQNIINEMLLVSSEDAEIPLTREEAYPKCDVTWIGGPVETKTLALPMDLFVGDGLFACFHRYGDNGYTLGTFLDECFDVKERGSKEGWAFLQGSLLDETFEQKQLNRNAKNVDKLYMLGCDIDTLGVAAESQVIERVRAMGNLAVIAPTHSYGKRHTDIPRSKFLEFAGMGPDADVSRCDSMLRRFLIEKLHYDESAVPEGSVKFVEQIHFASVTATKADGTIRTSKKPSLIKVAHAHMAKLRVYWPLKVPLDAQQPNFAYVWLTHLQGILTKKLGLPWDPSCSDASRMFFMPSMPIGGERRHLTVVNGGLLELPQVEVPAEWVKQDAKQTLARDGRRTAEKSKAKANGIKPGEKEKGSYPLDTKLLSIFKAHPDIQLINVFTALGQPQLTIRNREGTKADMACPFRDDHTTSPGEEDNGTMVTCDDGGSSVFCMHSGCRSVHGQDRVKMLSKAIEDCAGLTIEDLGQFCPGVVAGREIFVLDANDPKNLLAIIKKANKEDEALYNNVTRAIAFNSFKAIDRENLVNALKKTFGCNLTTIKKSIKEHEQNKREEKEAHAEDTKGADFGENRSIENGYIMQVIDWDGDGNPKLKIPVMREFEALGQKRNADGSSWGVLISFADPDGTKKELSISASMVHGRVDELASLLGDHGLIIRDKVRTAEVLNYVLSLPDLPRLLEVKQPGYHDDFRCFVDMNGVVHGSPRETVIMAESALKGIFAEPHGTLEGALRVKQLVVESENIAWFTGMLASVAGPLKALVPEVEAAMLCEVGESGLGKSLGMSVGASDWTTPKLKGDPGLRLSGKFTDNSLEGMLGSRSGHTVFIDDTRHWRTPENLKKISSIIHMVTSGSGKGRMTPKGTNKAVSRHDIFAFVGSEKTVPDMIAEARDVLDNGLVNRCPDCNIEARSTRVPKDDPVLAELESKVKENYGIVGPAFMERLYAEGWCDEAGRDRLRRLINNRAVRLTSTEGKQRAAEGFALLWVGGILMKKFGLMPRKAGVADCVRYLWGSFDQGTGETRFAKASVVDIVRKSIVQALKTGAIVTRQVYDDQRKTHSTKMIGVVDISSDTVHVFKDDLVSLSPGDTSQKILSALKETKALVPQGEKNLCHSYIPGLGKLAHYRIDLNAMGIDSPPLYGTGEEIIEAASRMMRDDAA